MSEHMVSMLAPLLFANVHPDRQQVIVQVIGSLVELNEVPGSWPQLGPALAIASI